MAVTTDVLLVSYNSPDRTRVSLQRLLDVADDSVAVWLWHNGDHEETLDVVRSLANHRRVAQFHHSEENVRLVPPTNWVFENGTGSYLSKIDDDAVLPFGWPGPLVRAHQDEARFGVLGCWRFLDEDLEPERARAKTQSFAGGHQVMRNAWVEGTSYLMKRQCVDDIGLLGEGQSFPSYCVELTKRGWVNGYYVPFVRYGNLDDPRTSTTMIRTDADLALRLPLSARRNGVTTVGEWTAQIRRSAHIVQTEHFEAKYFSGWRHQWKRVRRGIRRTFGDNSAW